MGRDGTGFWNIQKKLVGYTFACPRTEGEVMKVTSQQLDGIDVFRKFVPWADVKIS
jgi:hypothetical protein